MEAPDALGGDALNTSEAMADSQKIANQEDLRLQRFREWLQVNCVQSWCCEIRPSGEHAGLGLFATQDKVQGVLMVTPLRLAITPTTALQDPELGPFFMGLMAEGGADDRMLVMLYLVIERARGKFSFWAPYLDMLPTEFGSTLGYSEEELLELKGTHLFQATKKQRESLKFSFEDRGKPFADIVLSSVQSERREVEFQDFLWANSVFWSRAKSMPCPHSVVYPAQRPFSPALQALQTRNAPTGQQLDGAISGTTDFQIATNPLETCLSKESTLVELEDELAPCPSLADENDVAGNEASTHRVEAPSEADNEGVTNASSVWVEGLVPGIDFCNHDRLAVALWEVDGPEGSVTGVPNSMYLVIPGPESGVPYGKEIFISYGPKGNEELLYLYGFVVEDNPDDYLMIYFPTQALEDTVCSDAKQQLLQELNLPLRWLIPASQLRRGFYEELNLDSLPKIPQEPITTGYSWTGHRKTSSLVQKVVFPEDLLTALRIVSMEENEVYRVASMLEEISDPEAGRIPTDVDIRAAVWEVCGNTGAFQLLVDLLTSTMMALEEGTGAEAMDAELLAKDRIARSQTKEQSHSDRITEGDGHSDCNLLSYNKRASVIYRVGLKRLARGFLQEAEMALDLCLDYISSD